MPDLTTIPEGITEIPASPSNVTTVAPVAPTPAAAPTTPIQPTPEEKAAYEAQFGPAPLNPIRDLSAQELADLSVQDKDHFDIVSAFRSQPDLHKDPAIVQKAADALNLVKQRGFKLSDLPSPGQAAAGVLHSAKGFGKQLWNYANVGADVIGAAATSPFSTDVAETFAKDVDKRLSSNIAGTEEGMAGIADIGRKIIGKAGRLTGISKDFSQYTPQEKQNDLWAEVGRHEVQQERLQGKGPFTAAVTGGVAGEQNLNPEEISTLAAGDPVSFFAFGKGMEGAGALVPGVVKNAAGAAAAKIGEAATQVVPKAAGKTVEGVAQAMKTGGELVQPIGKILSVAGPVVGAAAKLTGADTLASVGGGILGGTAGVALKRAGQVSVEWSRGVKDFGKQIAGSAPIKSAYAQAGKDFLQTLPSATGAIAKGAAIDLGLAAVTAETPQETEGMATFGTALGALHGAGRMAGHMISGQIIAPREYGIKTVTPSSGQFKALDAMHNEAVRDAAPGVKARLNAIREFLSGTESGTDAFLGKDSASVEKALTESGVDPATAKAWSSQEGFFTADLKGQDGSPRRVVVMRNVEAAPHESFHVIQDVLGESANQQIDKIVHEAYADRWDHEGETYAKRLVGNLGDKTWQETILDASGWGLDEAKEKLFRDIGNKIRNETGAEPPPGMVETQSKAALGKLMDAAVLRNPHIDPKDLARHVWRDVLSPEEAKGVADKYIARELAAENFDAAFKAGKTQPPTTSLPAKLGRVAGRLISALGGEPIADRQSEIGQVPLKTPVVEAVTEASKAKGGIKSVVVPKTKGKPIVPTKPPSGPAEPTKPEEEQVKSGEEAKAIADEAPTAPQPGGTKSPRELLGQIAESISKGEGIKINYLSAPDEPAAATTSNRDTRRAIIETFRKMPPEARALWEKTFFPDRVIKTKTGYQVLGWAPEVFAANAHKMAAFLADHTALSPYEIDTTTKTFTPDAWRELYADVQKFVQNHKTGATGSGEALVVPKTVSDRGFTAPARRGGEVAIDQTKADFINLLFNFKLPETPRQTKGKMPLNLAGQEVSEATMPGRVEVPVRPRGEYKDEFAGRAIQEVNPLRNQVEAAAKSAGVEVPSLIEAVQRLNLENIKEVESAPEAPEFRGNTLTLSAGFQPAKLVKEVSEMSASEFQKWAEEQKGGFTLTAHDAGMRAPSREFVQDLKDKFKASTDLQRTLLADKNIDAYLAESFRSQFYREAFEAAEGTGSAGDYLRKKLGDAYNPPFPSDGEPAKVQFNPNEPDAVKRAAVRVKGTDDIFTGETHGEAWRNSKQPEAKFDYGFVTNSGEFLDRKQAWKRAKEMGQIEGDEWTPKPGELESVVFENANARAKYGFKGQAQPAPRLTDEEASKIAGSSVHRPEPTYKAASEKEGNPWVRNSKDPSHNADPSNEKRTLMVQFDTHLQSFGGKITRDEASAYYDKLYSGKREGYSRMADFWEIPQWMGFAAHLFGDSDVYVVRDMAQAKKFLNEAKYGKVIFSSMDVNRELIRDLAKDYDGTLDVGGYVDPKYFSDIPNVKWNDSLKTLADNAGVNYSEGVDYRHFVGSDSLPRLTLSSGCKFKCAFCTIEKVVKTAPEELVKQQAEEIAKLGTKLVYLNDKTFGQAPNYQMLSELNTMMKEKNPNFQGFVVQTTASQMVKLPKDWLAKSGIKFVELGIESYNDPILRSVRKPATEGLMDESTQALREAGITLIPNVLIGLPGETAETYARTLDFLKRNSDIISHANIYNLAVYKDTEMAKRITTASPGDYDENVREKTFYTDPEVHRVFAGDLYKMGEEFLDKVPKTAAQPSQGQPEAGVERLSDIDDMWPGGYAAINEQRRQVESGEVAGKEELGAEALQGNREDKAAKEATAQFAPRKPQDKDWKLISNNSESKKAWILPDGTPEQLGGMWHHQWLSEDPDGMRAAKKYGVEVTPFEGVDDDTTRQSALRKGFARVNYDNNSGRLVVEVLASRYNKLRDAIDQLAEANIKGIDKMTVNLLNHAMDAIVDSDSKSLIRYDTTKEKLANLPFSDRDPRLTQARKVAENPVFSTPETNEVLPSAYQGEPEYQVFDGTGKYIGKRDKYGHAEELLKQTGSGVIKSVRTFKNQAQPQGEQQDVLPGIESGKEYVGNAAVANMTSEELRNHFPEAIVPSPRDLEIPSAITKSPLYKEAGSEAKAVQAFADKLVSFANEFKDDPSFKAGSEWYSKFSPQLKKAFGKDAQIFAELLAATSPQTAAAVNFSYAFDALKSLRSGRFDKIIPKFNQGLDMIADDKWVPWYNKELKAGGIPKPPAQPTPAAFLEAWIHKHDLKPRQSNGALYGTHSIPVLQVFARKWLTESRGPKTLNFVKNLVGDGHEATIDLWADRTMRRMGYADHKDRWRILPGNGTGVAPEDFAFGQKAFRAAADKLKMQPDALQGALWFAEKKLWSNNGWGKLDLGDFSSEMEKIPMLESGFKQRAAAGKVKTKKEEPLDLFVEPRKLK